MITIEKRHFCSKQDFHLELSPIGNFKKFHVRATSGERNIGSHTEDTSSRGTTGAHYIDDTSSRGTTGAHNIDDTSSRGTAGTHYIDDKSSRGTVGAHYIDDTSSSGTQRVKGNKLF